MLAELHPPLSAFPFALTTAAFLSELLATVTKNHLFSRGAHYLLLLCALITAGTYYSGYFAAEHASKTFSVAESVVAQHQAFGKAVLIMLFVSLLLSQLRLIAAQGRVGFLCAYWVSLSCSLGLVIYTGFLGGNLVFRHGAGVHIVGSNP